eukprot:3157258-Rhodomonas_salina.2
MRDVTVGDTGAVTVGAVTADAAGGGEKQTYQPGAAPLQRRCTLRYNGGVRGCYRPPRVLRDVLY